VLARVRTTLTQYDEAQARLETLLAGNTALTWSRSKPPAALRASRLWVRSDRRTGRRRHGLPDAHEYGKDTAAERRALWGQGRGRAERLAGQRQRRQLGAGHGRRPHGAG
jgi:hypothetical protein